jgi:hypothetical protein
VENYSQKQIEKRFLERKKTPDMKREIGSGNRVRAKDFAAIHIQIYILLIFLFGFVLEFLLSWLRINRFI